MYSRNTFTVDFGCPLREMMENASKSRFFTLKSGFESKIYPDSLARGALLFIKISLKSLKFRCLSAFIRVSDD
jgi:hypothetical protein